jgi:hypothetical protein
MTLLARADEVTEFFYCVCSQPLMADIVAKVFLHW